MDTDHSPRFFRRNSQPVARLIMCLALSIGLLVAEGRFGVANSLRDTLSLALYPAQWLVNAPVTAIHQAREFFVEQAHLYSENRQLREEALILTARVQRYEELAQENQQLRALHNLAQLTLGEAKLSEILYAGRDPFSHKIVIDKGSQHNIQAGFPVTDTKGLIGQVTRTAPITSEVTLIIEKNHSVPVMVQRNGIRAVLYGTGGGVELRYMMRNADIVVGDLLVTSGIDGIYPAGLDVARVSSVETHSGTFLTIRCTPIGEIDRRKFALVLTEKTSLPIHPNAPDEKMTARTHTAPNDSQKASEQPIPSDSTRDKKMTARPPNDAAHPRNVTSPQSPTP